MKCESKSLGFWVLLYSETPIDAELLQTKEILACYGEADAV